LLNSLHSVGSITYWSDFWWPLAVRALLPCGCQLGWLPTGLHFLSTLYVV